MNLYKLSILILLSQIVFSAIFFDICLATTEQNEESVKENKFSSSNSDITKVC
jgi:hypothetical protein